MATYIPKQNPVAGKELGRFDGLKVASAATPRRGVLIPQNSTMLLLCLFLSSVVAYGNVWEDCTAWYMGGTDKDGDSVFENGELTDIRHAADPDAPTHGGGIRTGNGNASHRLETVVSATSGRTFPNQRVIYLAQPEGTTSSGAYGVKEEDIRLPFAATTNCYTFLLRFRMDENQPTNRTFVSILDFGYKGGSNTRYSFYVRYYPETEQFGLLCNNGSTAYTPASPTNDLCQTMRETWVEMVRCAMACTRRALTGSSGIQRPFRLRRDMTSLTTTPYTLGAVRDMVDIHPRRSPSAAPHN